MISDYDLDQALQHIDTLAPDMKARVLGLLEERDRMRRKQDAHDHFLPFVNLVWPEFIAGAHHTIMAEAFEKIASGDLKRLIINMPPRFTKSELSSWLLPAWLMGRNPKNKVIQASNTEALASGFGRKVRNLISGEGGDTEQTTKPFQEVFPDVWLSKDSQAAAGWHTNRGGEYFAIGVNGKVTGKGANCAYFSCKVLTKRGYVQIADVRVGDQVLGYDHEREATTWTTVRAISTQRKPDLVNVNGFLCTPDHRIYTRRNYRRALEARAASDDVLSLPEGFHQGFERVPPGDPSNWKAAFKTILLGRVPEQPEAARVPTVRRLESPDGDNLQALLPEGQTRPPGVQELWHRDQAAKVRAGQEHPAARRQRERLLQTPVLSRILRHASEAIHRGSDWVVQNMRNARPAGRREVLFDEVLRFSGQDAKRTVHRSVEPGTTPDQEALQRRVRDVRQGEGPGAGPSRRSRRDEPYGGQLGAALRALSWLLPQRAHPSSARFVADALQGSGHWVVDLQTDTENFFCEGVLAHNCAIIDDAHSEQEAKQAESNPEVFDSVWEWYSSGIRQRLQPGGAIVIPMTRWSKRDLTGRLIKQMQDASGLRDEWEVISFPAILDEGLPTERSMWPGFWPLDELQKTRNALPVSKWQAQYMQDPTSEEGAIIKREHWRKWGVDTAVDIADRRSSCPGPQHMSAWLNMEPPACEYIISSWDTAFRKTQRADFSAMTTWGIFKAEDPKTGQTVNNLILLSAFKARMEFPELKRKVKQFYDEDQPDTLLIEDKGSGMSLIQELRSMGLPVENFSYGRGSKGVSNDKVSRANMIADIFASGYVWMPERRYAEEVVIECAEFPHSEHDDLVDSVVQAMLRFRAGGFIGTANDQTDDEEERRYIRKRYY